MEQQTMSTANDNQVIVRNECDRPREPEVPHVRKISRFQVSHVKEAEEAVKIPTNIVHGSDILLENVSPDQQQQQQHQQHHQQQQQQHPPQPHPQQQHPQQQHPQQQHPQQQQQLAHEYAAHNIQAPIERSPDKMDPMVSVIEIIKVY